MAEARVIKFCKQVGHIKSRHTVDESPLKGAWSGSRDPFFYFYARDHISGTAEATVAKFCMQIEYIKCLAFDDRLHPNGRGQGHVTFFKYCLNHIFGIGEVRHFKFRVLIDT